MTVCTTVVCSTQYSTVQFYMLPTRGEKILNKVNLKISRYQN